jgi:hypothetical protein
VARTDYLSMCKRLGIVPAPSAREWATAFGEFWKALTPMVYWNERVVEYWYPDPPANPSPLWTPEKMREALGKERENCAKGKHWLGLNPDLSPSTRCAWDFCDHGK